MTGGFGARGIENSYAFAYGAFYGTGSGRGAAGDRYGTIDFGFNAARCSTLYKDNLTVVQPTSISIHVKTRYY